MRLNTLASTHKLQVERGLSSSIAYLRARKVTVTCVQHFRGSKGK